MILQIFVLIAKINDTKCIFQTLFDVLQPILKIHLHKFI